MTEVEYQARLANMVANGAEFMDSRYPGWASEIDLEALDMSDVRYCILGQLGFELSTRQLEEECGFWRPCDLPYEIYPGFYEDIQKHWEPEIARRQRGLA